MVNVVSKTCSDKGCSTHPSYGVAGSRRAEVCSKHARAGIVNMVHKTCIYDGCPTLASHGVAGSRNAEFCSKHARAEMLNVVKYMCGYDDCPTLASYGVAGCKETESCSKHAKAGMVTVKNKTCGYEGCSTTPSCDVSGSTKAESCSKHPRAGMVNAEKGKCGYEGCFTIPSYGVTGGTKAEFCSQHARTGMMDVVSHRCREKGCFESPLDTRDNFDEEKLSQQHASAHDTATVFDTTKFSTGKGTPGRSRTEGDGERFADVRGVKRQRTALSGFGANDGLGARLSLCGCSRQGKRTPSLSARPLVLPGHPPSGTDGEVSSRVGAKAGMKVELAVPSPTHGGGGIRRSCEQASPLSGRNSERGSRGLISSGGGGTERLCGSPVVVPRYLGTFDDAAFEEVQETSNVKLKLEVSSSS
ncbi:unnamed protein product [Sphacelaria rigidula]